ncbi:hypothetical protein B0H63DRAFT_449169 [Podospora didyma]|uniref:Uncharacterized protein n=1 Tax=Podospora didyma TaxID=330526 RepID=A0AAE0NP22_9PEZI|nr:hypothetical protein B0H63DRAFT_449169 [Podospora didyma]
MVDDNCGEWRQGEKKATTIAQTGILESRTYADTEHERAWDNGKLSLHLVKIRDVGHSPVYRYTDSTSACLTIPNRGNHENVELIRERDAAGKLCTFYPRGCQLYLILVLFSRSEVPWYLGRRDCPARWRHTPNFCVPSTPHSGWSGLEGILQTVIVGCPSQTVFQMCPSGHADPRLESASHQEEASEEALETTEEKAPQSSP